MTRILQVSLTTLVLVAATSTAIAKPRHTDSGSTIVARTAYGVGEIVVDDPRILDLSGDYTLDESTTSTSTSVNLTIVQDARGKLAGSFTLSGPDGTSAPYPAVGSLAVQRKQDLRFEFSGKSRSSGHHDRANNGDRIEMRARGVFDGTAFQTELRLKSNGKESRTTVTLIPASAVRGVTVSDSQSYAPRPGILLTTRTVSLPWGSRVLPALERTHSRSTQFSVASNVPRKGRPLGPHQVFGMRVHGATTSSSDFYVMLNHIRLGYGHLDSAASTTVSKSLFTPISIWEGTDTTSEVEE